MNDDKPLDKSPLLQLFEDVQRERNKLIVERGQLRRRNARLIVQVHTLVNTIRALTACQR